MEYTIDERERTTFLDKRGRLTDGYRIWYTMEDQRVDYVEIAKAQYNAANVKAAIEADIAKHVELMAG